MANIPCSVNAAPPHSVAEVRQSAPRGESSSVSSHFQNSCHTRHRGHGCRRGRRSCSAVQRRCTKYMSHTAAFVSDSNCSSCSSPLGDSERLLTPQDGVRGKGRTKQSSLDSHFSIVSLNPRSLAAHAAELSARLDILKPTIVAISETWLDSSTSRFEIPNYVPVSRRDRSSAPNRGGISLYCRNSYNCMDHLENSKSAELAWHLLHSDIGPILLAFWYRQQHDLSAIECFEAEWRRHSWEVEGTIVVGDLNIHHQLWLKHSKSDTPDSRALKSFCDPFGFKQHVREPTRGPYLLDLVLSDLQAGVACEVLSEIADHKLVFSFVKISIPLPTLVDRKCWMFKEAKWQELIHALNCID